MALVALDYMETLMFKVSLSWFSFLNMIAQPLLLEKLLDSAKNINDKIVA